MDQAIVTMGTAHVVFSVSIEQLSHILGVDETLMKRCWITLCVLASTFDVDTENLRLYNRETMSLFIAKYSW